MNSPIAYLDPGTGSMIVQGIVGAIVGTALAAKVYWHKIKAFFSKTEAPALVDGAAASDAATAATAQESTTGAPADGPTDS